MAGVPTSSDDVNSGAANSAQGASDAELIAAFERLEGSGSTSERSRALLGFAGLLASRLRRIGARVLTGGRPLADLLLELAPHLSVRDLPTLQKHFPDREAEALADVLVLNAARATAAVGVAGGAAAAAEWAAFPTLAAVPIQILAETVAVALIEVNLVAELHACYGMSAPGAPTQRGVAYVMAWAQRRGIDPMSPTRVPMVLGIAGRRQVAHRLGGRLARNLGTLAPMLVGALVGARWNRSETQRLAGAVRSDLRSRLVR